MRLDGGRVVGRKIVFRAGRVGGVCSVRRVAFVLLICAALVEVIMMDTIDNSKGDVRKLRMISSSRENKKKARNGTHQQAEFIEHFCPAYL